MNHLSPVVQSKRAKLVAMLVAAGMSLSAATAQAAITIPTEVTAMITDLVTLVGSIMAASVAVWVAIKGSAVIYKLANKFISKAGA